MSLDARLHWWPETPELRQLKILHDNEIIFSTFVSKRELLEFIKKLEELYNRFGNEV